tara:strand:+ start:400 stop:720 length:321 start_codon:yes stop_codon:yes gene_type:complete
MDRWNINLLDDGNVNCYGNLVKKEDITPRLLQKMKELEEINKVPINKNCKYINNPIVWLSAGVMAIKIHRDTGEPIRLCNWDGCNCRDSAHYRKLDIQSWYQRQLG